MHTEAFTQTPLYTWRLLHRDPFKQKQLHRDSFRLLDTEEFAQSNFYTETILHTETSTEPISREKVSRDKHFTAASGDAHAFRAEGSPKQVIYIGFYYFSSEDEHARSPQTVGRAPATTCILPQFFVINTRFARDGCVSEASVHPPLPP